MGRNCWHILLFIVHCITLTDLDFATGVIMGGRGIGKYNADSDLGIALILRHFTNPSLGPVP
ncbi:hypothetical protein GGR50DRAFT_699064 [Xylaria sp. CBS 124048]|nr:hypothetical protein GGR50DRAFT_699064 [Xylaria sp. CBS 124048]